MVLGTGGAARAISFNLAWKTKLKSLTLLDINEELLKSLKDSLSRGTAAAIHAGILNDNSLEKAMEQADVIIHCTPVGMHPKEDAALIPPELFRPGQAVLDIVYTPLETKLLKNARSRDAKVISGVEMFINQAVLQFKQFTGVDAPVDVMREVVLENLKK